MFLRKVLLECIFISCIVSAFFILFTSNAKQAFTQTTTLDVNLLLERIRELNKKLDDVDLKSDNVVETIQKLESQIVSIENNHQTIIKNISTTNLKGPEREKLQAKLDNLRDEIFASKIRAKTLLQLGPYLKGLKSLIGKSVQSQGKERINTVALFLVVIGIVLTFISLSFWLFLWYRNELQKQKAFQLKFKEAQNMFGELYLLLNQIAKKEATKAAPKTGDVEITRILEESKQAEVLGQGISNQDKYIKYKELQIDTPQQQQKETALQEFCRLYNALVDGSGQQEFWERYKPIRISVKNSVERRRHPELEPDFITSTDGDYYAIKWGKDNQYVVVPRPGMAFQEYSYGPGAMGLVFDCPNYNLQFRYHHVKVIKPALFETDPTMERWKLRARGRLDLGKGE
jgi:hypothetical protein